MVPAGARERLAAKLDAGFGAKNADAMQRPFETRAETPREMRERTRRDSDEQFEIFAARKRVSLGIVAEPPRPLRARPARPERLPLLLRSRSQRISDRGRSTNRRRRPSSPERWHSPQKSALPRNAACGLRKARNASRSASPLNATRPDAQSSPARAAPSTPVTASTALGRPPARVFTFDGRTSPTAAIAIVSAGARDKSPPAISSLHARAHAAIPV